MGASNIQGTKLYQWDVLDIPSSYIDEDEDGNFDEILWDDAINDAKFTLKNINDKLELLHLSIIDNYYQGVSVNISLKKDGGEYYYDDISYLLNDALDSNGNDYAELAKDINILFNNIAELIDDGYLKLITSTNLVTLSKNKIEYIKRYWKYLAKIEHIDIKNYIW